MKYLAPLFFASAYAVGPRALMQQTDKSNVYDACDAAEANGDFVTANQLCPILKQFVNAPAAYAGYSKDQLEAMVKNQCEGSSCQSGTLNLQALFGYGCWCFFGNINSALGRGPPVDAYDATCQKMALCYRCIFVDAENESDDDCDPFNESFTATLNLGGFGGSGVSNITADCRTDNQANCSWRTCSCAMTMLTSFFNLSFDSNNQYDDSIKHSNGFDYDLECPTQSPVSDRQCCGFYPDRRTYGRGEARECCHEKSIYNPLRHICCPDGTHLGLGHNCE